MNKQEFLKSFQKWRAENGYAKRDFCRNILRAFKKADISLQENGVDDICAIHGKLGERPEWIDYVLQQPNPSTFIGQLFNKGNKECVTLNDPTTISNNRLSKDNESENEMQEIIEVFYNFIKTYNYVPEFKELNYSGNIKKYFKTEKELYSACAGLYDLSSICFNELDFSPEYNESLTQKVKKYKRFIITTAVVNKKVNKNFIKSIKNYCDKKDALCLVLPCQDVENRKTGFEYQLDPYLKEFPVVYKSLYLNDNLYISDIKISARQILPTTGIHQFTTKASCILASPQQNMMPIPNQHKKIPHVLMCTGSCTISDYNNDKYMSSRLNKIAEYNHVDGAIIIELEDDKIFHFRQVQAGQDGEFIDLGVQYNPDNTTEIVTDSYMVLGDAHFGEHEEDVLSKTKEMIVNLSVKDLALHDVFGASSVTHWDVNKSITRAIKSEEGKLSLREEAELCATKMMEFLHLVDGNIDIVYSNHPLFLERYLEDGRYAKDPQNLYYSLDIVKAFIEGVNPFKFMICNKTSFIYLDDKDFDRFNFLEKLDDKSVYGVEIAQHGSFGAGGAKGSLVTYKKAFEKSMSAHTHFPCINGGAWSVGTNSILDPSYARGLSNCMHTNGIIYRNGSRQLINIIKNKDGKYTWRI